ncbi:MAG: DUF3817 domain-containing protein [Flavobacterium sp.]|nr:MAG: DUF3817 domain-containing protein [Flavobacterium sp.]
MIKTFKTVATLEGISLLLLFFVAMPLKYIADMPQYVRIVGLIHGLLFVAYIAMAYMLKEEEQWTNRRFGAICLLSIVPFGTFYMERKYLKKA